MKNQNIRNVKTDPQTQKGKSITAKADIIQLIVFDLGDEEYGADISQVREIIRTGIITPIPDSPDFIKGISNIRGEVPVIIDLKARFFLPPVKREVVDRHIVITEQEKNIFGLLVDEVSEVIRIPETDIKSAPELVTRIDREYVSGVITLENRLIILLDLAKVLSNEELARLSEFSQKHRSNGGRQEMKERHEQDSSEAEIQESDQETAQPQPV
ncbi:chemotaxis protein CheW [Planctomycetota bacterium]